MKRILCLFVLLVLLCTACGKKEIRPETGQISFCAHITRGGEKYDCEMTSRDESLSVRVLAPGDLSGLRLKYSPDGVSAEYLGLVYTPETGKMPFGAASDAVYRMLRDSWRQDAAAVEQDGEYCLNGKVDGKEYRMIFAKTGLPLRAELASDGYTVEFSDVTVLR